VLASARVRGGRRYRGFDLPRDAVLVNLGVLVSSIGTGGVLPFSLIYLHSVRGIDLATTGVVVGIGSTFAVVSNIASGRFLHERSAKRLLAAALLTDVLAIALFPLIRNAWQAGGVLSLEGLGLGATMTAQSTLLTRIVEETRRHAAFAQNQMLTNVGLGAGALLGGLVAETSEPSTFTTLFLIDAATFGEFAVMLAKVSEPEEQEERAALGAGEKTTGSYRLMLADRRFMQLLAINLAFVTFGFVPLVMFLPIYAQSIVGLQEFAVGAMLGLNTAVVVVAQLPVSRLLEGRRRMPFLAISALSFGASWALVAAGGEMSKRSGFALMLIAVALFAVGECIYNVIATPLAVKLAPNDLISRYIAAIFFVFAVGRAIAPPTQGWLLGSAPLVYWLVMAGGLIGVAYWILRLETSIPQEARDTPASAVQPL
jgi:predicted MFS family arabinose efflux permease